MPEGVAYNIHINAPPNSTISVTYEDGTTYTTSTDETGFTYISVVEPGKYVVTGTDPDGNHLSHYTFTTTEANLYIANVERIGNATPLDSERYDLAATSLGDYIIFAGRVCILLRWIYMIHL